MRKPKEKQPRKIAPLRFQILTLQDIESGEIGRADDTLFIIGNDGSNCACVEFTTRNCGNVEALNRFLDAYHKAEIAGIIPELILRQAKIEDTAFDYLGLPGENYKYTVAPTHEFFGSVQNWRDKLVDCFFYHERQEDRLHYFYIKARETKKFMEESTLTETTTPTAQVYVEYDGSNDDAEEENVTTEYNFDVEEEDDELVDEAEVAVTAEEDNTTATEVQEDAKAAKKLVAYGVKDTHLLAPAGFVKYEKGYTDILGIGNFHWIVYYKKPLDEKEISRYDLVDIEAKTEEYKARHTQEAMAKAEKEREEYQKQLKKERSREYCAECEKALREIDAKIAELQNNDDEGAKKELGKLIVKRGKIATNYENKKAELASLEGEVDVTEYAVSPDILHAKITDAELAAIKSLSYDERKALNIKINQVDLRKVYPPDGQRRGFICPICVNGSGRKGDGIVATRIDDADNWFFLHNCFKGHDFQGKLFSIIARENSLHYANDFFKILAIGKRFVDAAASSNVQDLPFLPTEKKYTPEQIAMRKQDIIDAQKNIADLPLVDRRNLSLQTLQDLGFGYIEKWQYSGNRIDGIFYSSTPRIVAPYTDCTYNAIIPKSAREKFKYLDKSMNEGSKGIFNFDSIQSGINFIVEGEFDAASFYEVGYKNVAALGGKGHKKLIARLNEKFPNKEDRLQISFVVCLDNDVAGRTAAPYLVQALIAEGYPATCKFLDEGTDKVDANDILCNDGVDVLKSKIENFLPTAQTEIDKSRDEIISRDVKKDFSDEPAPNDDAKNATDIANARDMLNYINCERATYTEWLHVGMILKTTGNPIEDWLNWSATDAEKYDEKACRDKWKTFKETGALTIATLYLMASKNGYKMPKFKAEYNDRAVADNSLYSQLNKVKKQISDFETEKNAAIELLKNLETFDSESVFAEEITNAAAFAKIFDRKIYSDFIRAVKLYGDKHPTEKAAINDLKAVIKDDAEFISNRHNELKDQQATLIGAINNKKFISSNPDFKNYVIPAGYSMSMEHGVIQKIDDKGHIKIACECPVVIAGKTKSVEEKKFKLILQLWTRDGKRKTLPPYPASTIFNARKIIDLADDGLTVSTFDAAPLTAFLNAFNVENENLIPQTCTVPRCGWHRLNDKNIFVDPRRSCTFTDEGKEYPLITDSNSQFAKSLTTHGTLENWKRAYNLAQSSPVAKFIVAATVAAPLLDVVGGRNFLFFVYSKTRSGKTTALSLGASAVGNEKIIRSFDATKNGLIGAAADLSDYAFLIDEKQVADNRISEQFRALVMALGNGIGRTKLNKDSTVRNTDYWRTIALMTGETPLLDDSANGGAFTRLLQIYAPNPILPPDTCRDIRAIIKDNYGHAFPLVLDEIFSYGQEKLKVMYNRIIDSLTAQQKNILDEHRRYVAMVTLADFLLNKALGVDINTAKNNSIELAHAILHLAPTLDEIDDTQREINAVFGFIAENQSRFIGGNIELDKIQKFYGKIMFEGGLIYITVDAMKEACKSHNLNYERVVADLIDAKVIAVADKIEKGYKEPRKLFLTRLHGVPARCYKLIAPANTADAE